MLMGVTAEESVEVPIVWVGVEQEPLQSVNTFLLQLDSDRVAVFLTAGIVTPPPVVGTPEEQRDQLKAYNYVSVKPVARLAMTRPRFEELRALMNRVAESWPSTTEDGDTE